MSPPNWCAWSSTPSARVPACEPTAQLLSRLTAGVAQAASQGAEHVDEGGSNAIFASVTVNRGAPRINGNAAARGLT